jgi:predicted phosphoribosyltransferase
MQTAFFQNRVDAGEKLAKELLRPKQNQTSLQDAIIVAIGHHKQFFQNQAFLLHNG